MLPLVVMLAVAPFLPLLRFVHSEEIDAIDSTKLTIGPELILLADIIGIFISFIMEIYFFLVALGAWKSVKDY